MPQTLELVLEISNFFFSFVFNVEAVIKITAFGSSYFKNNWNNFDFFIVLTTDINYIIFFCGLQSPGSIMTLFRAFRIIRIVKLIKASKNIRVLLQTLVYILPNISNIGALVLLVLFIYACLGMQLFASVMFRESIN